MARAEELADKYSKNLDYYHYASDDPAVAYKAGYEQAEKDYAKLKELADKMYSAAQYLTTDASQLHKAMEEYHKFVCYELNK